MSSLGGYVFIYYLYSCLIVSLSLSVPEGVAVEELEKIKADSKNYKGQGPDEISDFYGPRYCQHCKSFKPPRAHHCRDLNRFDCLIFVFIVSSQTSIGLLIGARVIGVSIV